MNNNRTLKWIVAIGIALLFNLSTHLITNLIYPEPRWDDFCGEINNRLTPTTETECLAIDGKWQPQAPAPIPPDGLSDDKAGKPVTGWCDATAGCRAEYETARDEYARRASVIWIIFGVAALVTGLTLGAVNTAVSLGASLGGLLAFFITTVRFWENLSDYLRLLLSLAALAILLWVSVKKLKDR